MDKKFGAKATNSDTQAEKMRKQRLLERAKDVMGGEDLPEIIEEGSKRRVEGKPPALTKEEILRLRKELLEEFPRSQKPERVTEPNKTKGKL